MLISIGLFSAVYERSHLGAIDLARLSSTSSTLRQRLAPQRWDINRKLRRFTKDPCAFRSCLGTCQALSSDDFAFQFMGGMDCTVSDLAIYVGRDRVVKRDTRLVHAETLHNLITEEERYTFDSSSTCDVDVEGEYDEVCLGLTGL